MIGGEESENPVALSFRLNATLLFFESHAKRLIASSRARLLSPRFVPFHGRLSKDTYLLHWLFTSSPVFSPLFASFPLSRRFYLYLHSSDIQAQHFRPPSFPLPSLPLISSLLYFIRNFTLPSRIPFYLADLSPYLPAPCLISPSFSGTVLLQFSSSLLVVFVTLPFTRSHLPRLPFVSPLSETQLLPTSPDIFSPRAGSCLPLRHGRRPFIARKDHPARAR